MNEITSARDDAFYRHAVEKKKVEFHYLPHDNPEHAFDILKGFLDTGDSDDEGGDKTSKKADYDPGESRDESGKWTSGGGGGTALKERPEKHKKIQPLLDAINEPDGGFSIHDHIGDGPTTGYMVSLNKSTERDFPVSELSADHIRQYQEDHADELSQPGTYFGAWHNPSDGRVYLDVSTNFKDKDEAMKAAKKADQIAIFDLSTFDSLVTAGVGPRKQFFSAPVSAEEVFDSLWLLR